MAESTELSAFAEDNFDPRPSDIFAYYTELEPAILTNRRKRIAVIRTSDRILFKRCRRRWGWNSHLRQNLGSKTAISPLWLGSGFHFALEDFHGQRLYKSARTAFDAYVYATRAKGGIDALPYSWEEDSRLAAGMLDYYEFDWLANRDPIRTFTFDGRLQLEVNFRIEIPFDASEWGFDEVVYSGTLDRVAIDENGTLWIVEYKTAKVIQTSHYQTDPQVTAYCWAASLLYPGYAIGGVIYQQHKKMVPNEPKMLASGKLSTDKRQSTTYHHLRRRIEQIYGSLDRAPVEHIDTLNHFSGLEDLEKNNFIRRDRLYRNQHQAEAEGQKVLLEVAEMLNPDLDLYPNPTRDCSFCSFQGPCVSMDDGGDWEYELEAFNHSRETNYDSWRKKLPDPATFQLDGTINRQVF
jgi:hypothetical protein